jgi:hypothetical protein
MTAPLNISSDDAAFFSLSSSSANTDSESDADGEEDSATNGAAGASKIGQLDMFRARPVKHTRTKGGSRAVPTTQIVFTPGAHRVP